MNTENLYHYTECGLDYVWLGSGVRLIETGYGPAAEITDADTLDQAIAEFIVTHKKSLTGQDVRFLRSELDLTQAELAGLLGKDAQSVARWEKEKTTIPSTEDRALRQIYLEGIGQRPIFTETARWVGALDQRIEHIVFERIADHWAQAAA
jgi:putative transcriptional regulator